MENIEKVLNLLSQLTDNATHDAPLLEHIHKLYPSARKEFEALKASGVEVKIETVERVTVVKPSVRRARRAKKVNPQT